LQPSKSTLANYLGQTMASKTYTVRPLMTLHLERIGKDNNGFQTVRVTTYEAGETVSLPLEEALKYANQIEPDPNFPEEMPEGEKKTSAKA
jgi:hypothetical protein